MELLCQDADFVIAIKPPGALSTDQPGGVPDLARQALGDPNAPLRTVHRLDRVAGGLMVLARTAAAASDLSRQIREGTFSKTYLAVCLGVPALQTDRWTDLLRRDPRERKTYVTDQPGKGVQEAILDYRVLAARQGLSLVEVRLLTGRTHQIRCQFASRSLPLIGDRKYGADQGCNTALWSWKLGFCHPQTGAALDFCLPPPGDAPWTAFADLPALAGGGSRHFTPQNPKQGVLFMPELDQNISLTLDQAIDRAAELAAVASYTSGQVRIRQNGGVYCAVEHLDPRYSDPDWTTVVGVLSFPFEECDPANLAKNIRRELAEGRLSGDFIVPPQN